MKVAQMNKNVPTINATETANADSTQPHSGIVIVYECVRKSIMIFL
jgi:hypothetical protein